MRKLAVVVIAVVGAAATSAHGEPLALSARYLADAARPAPGVHAIDYRRCWYREGKRHCRWFRGERGDRDRDGYYEYQADKLPFGSRIWWEQMARENRAGNPGGGRN